jgi:Tfp pilus assembly protein PilF
MRSSETDEGASDMHSVLRAATGGTIACTMMLLSGCALLARPGSSQTGDQRPAMAAGDQLAPPQTLQACLTTADLLAAQGHPREASLLYEKARLIDPSAIDYSRRLAGLHDLQGNLPQAAVEFQAALSRTPGDPDLLNDYACLLNRQGQFAQAEQHLRQALAISPQHPRALTNLGIVLANQQRYQEAFDAFAVVVGPAAAHSNLGMLLAKQGRNEEALRAFERALAVNPQLAQARAGQEYLRGEQPRFVTTVSN